ncbi:MAG: transposase, partial [Bacteroidota bacterium]
TNKMSRYKIHDQQGLYFLTLTVVGWIDIFSRADYKHIILDSLRYCQKEKGLNVYAYIIMSNHIHLIASAKEGYELSNILRDFKKFTAKQILKRIQNGTESRKEWLMYLFRFFAKGNVRNREHQFWRADNHPMELYSPTI